MPKIVVVPHSAIVVRRPEKPDLQSPTLCTGPLRTRFGKRGVRLPSSPTRPQAPNAGMFRSSTLRRILHRGSTGATGKDARTDHIFGLHAHNQQQELRRRNTEESLRRKAKTSVSRPLKSPPAPNRDVLQKYGERQDDWKKRSMALKNEKPKDSRVKRWSLRTWKVDSGREHVPNSRSPKALPTGPRAKPVPSSPAKRVMSFRSQRWSFRPVPETLSVINDRKKYTRLPDLPSKHNRAASDTRVPRNYQQRTPSIQPQKAASMRSLRPQVSYDNHLAVPKRQHAQGHTDQRFALPAIRQQISFDDRLAMSSRQLGQAIEDQRNVHPALRQQTSLDGSLAVRTRSGIQQHLDQRHIHPALRTNPPVITSLSTRPQIAPMISHQQHKPAVPRVRIIPPSTFIQPHNFTTKHTILPIKPPTMGEQTALVRSLNGMRASVSVEPLDLHPLLSNHAQDHAALYLAPLPPPKPLPPGFAPRRSSARQIKHRATTIEAIEFKSPGSAAAVRLISPPGLGALACGELWAGGKYKRHKTVRHGQVPSQHRFTLLPGFELNDRDSVATNESWNAGASWCGCAEWDAYRAVTDGRWKCCGVGRAEDGRWVVELWEPEGGETLK